MSDQTGHNSNTRQAVSVIIPFRNEASNLGQLINDLQGQTHSNFEVIFVNDHSEDHFKPLFNSLPTNFSLVNLEGGYGKKAAIAAGMAQAKGEVIFQTDADCCVPPAWIRTLLQQFDNTTSVVCGSVQMVPFTNFWSRFAALDFLSLQASGMGCIGKGKPFMGSAASLAYRKDFYQSCKQLNPEKASGDDVFLIQEALKSGGNVKGVTDPEATVRTHAPTGLFSFLKQRVRWGAKTSDYTSGFAKVIAAVVFLMACCFLGWIAYSIFHPLGGIALAVFFLLKMTADFQLLYQFTRQSGGTKLLKEFFPMSIIYPFYIITTAILILTTPKKWKGRRIS